MKWKGHSSESIQSGKWVITRTRHSGKENFTLWHGDDRVGDYDRSDEAKQAAKEMGDAV